MELDSEEYNLWAAFMEPDSPTAGVPPTPPAGSGPLAEDKGVDGNDNPEDGEARDGLLVSPLLRHLPILLCVGSFV